MQSNCRSDATGQLCWKLYMGHDANAEMIQLSLMSLDRHLGLFKFLFFVLLREFNVPVYTI
jgi:hypothetical protein